MRSVNATFSSAIAEGSVKVAELYILELSDGSKYYYTSHSKNIIWDAGSNTYLSIVISRGPVQYSNNFESDTVQVIIGNISGDLVADVQANILDGCKVTIKRVLWDNSYAADLEIILFVGYADVEFDRTVLNLNCRPLEDSLNSKIPRHTFQEPCNNSLFDDTCTLVQSDHQYSGTATGGTALTLIDTTRGSVYKVDFDNGDGDNPVEVGDALSGDVGAGTGVCVQIVYLTATTGTIWYVEQVGVQYVNDEVLTGGGNTITVNGTPAEDTNLYIIGELEMTGGNNSGQRRPILSDGSNTITVLWPFPNVVANGDTYNLFPGCDKTAETCDLTFDNDENFRGFLYIPRVEETVM